LSYTFAGSTIGNPFGDIFLHREKHMIRTFGVFCALALGLMLSEPASGQC